MCLKELDLKDSFNFRTYKDISGWGKQYIFHIINKLFSEGSKMVFDL